MTTFRKVSLALGLISFLKRYPGTLIVGGPPAFALLGSRYRSLTPGYFSQCGQDAFVSSYFFRAIAAPRFPKVFVDVGCNHPVKHNNSHFFEKYLGFQILAIDALATHQNDWASLRPASTLEITAVGSVEGEVEFEEVEPCDRGGDMFSSVSGASGKAPTLGRHIRKVPITPLSKLLQRHGLSAVGIMSIDIEGYELQALQGIDFNQVQIDIIVVENNSQHALGDDRIRELLISKDYRFHARIWGMDDVFVHQRLTDL